MEDFGDYIYLIVIAIAALSSFLGKKKKPIPDAERSLPEMPDLDDVIPEYTEYTESPRPLYEELKINKKLADIPTYETVSDFTSMKAKMQVVHTDKHFVGSELTVSDDNDFNILELNTPDDVKKAFIYSEIFNRKYT